MTIQELTDYFLQYGAFFIYLIVLLEYLNFPGFRRELSCLWQASGRREARLVFRW